MRIRRKMRGSWVSLPPDWPVKILSPLGGLLLLCLATGVYANRQQIDRAIRNSLCAIRTRSDLSAVVRALRQYHAANGRLPGNPRAFLATALKGDRTYPADCDHWGTPYRVEPDPDGFWVRSAGPDRRYDTRDDLLLRGSTAEKS